MERNTVLTSQRVQEGLNNVWKEMKALRGYLFQEYDLTPASLDRMEASLNEIWTGCKNDVVALGSIPGVMDRVYDLKRRNADLQNELWEKNCIQRRLRRSIPNSKSDVSGMDRWKLICGRSFRRRRKSSERRNTR